MKSLNEVLKALDFCTTVMETNRRCPKECPYVKEKGCMKALMKDAHLVITLQAATIQDNEDLVREAIQKLKGE